MIAFADRSGDEPLGSRRQERIPPLALVTVVIPCYNEERHIGPCLESIFRDQYDQEHLRVVVVDGMSTDATRSIVGRFAEGHANLHVLDNPSRSKPKALNLALRRFPADVFIRVDAHALYPPNYISSLVRGLEESGSDNIGGVLLAAEGESPMAKAIAVAITHPFTAGNALHRTGASKPKLVDTVFGGCYRWDIIRKVGWFNEKLVRTQDREYNIRVRAAGGRILLDPSIRCVYFPRSRFVEYVKWTYDGSRWLFEAPRFTRAPMLHVRNFVPVSFVLYHIVPPLAAVVGRDLAILSTLPIAAYYTLAVCVSIKEAVRRKQWALLLPVFAVMVATHYSYGAGSLVGLLRRIVLPKDIDRTSDPMPGDVPCVAGQGHLPLNRDPR